jgi:hypothetical protein
MKTISVHFGSPAAHLTHQIETSVAIAAPPAQVWAVLSDGASYPDWNPVMRRLDGLLAVGQRLTLQSRMGARTFTFRPTVLEATPERCLRWLGHLIVPGLFDGEHQFVLTPTAGGTLLQHSEHFRGLLVPLLRSRLETGVRDDFGAINAALRVRAEAVWAACARLPGESR